MGLFVCAKCECVENTALGHWWSKHRIDDFQWDESNEKYKGLGLCSECKPLKFSDGTDYGRGKWHGKFEKEHYSKVDYQHELMQLPSAVGQTEKNKD
jgi:hypothetical protein